MPCICVELHTRDCRLIVWLWRPFSKCLAFVLRGRELRFSLVHAFASLLLLFHSKILFVSFQLLARAELYDPNGQMVGPAMVFYDASIGYFSAPHFPFALLAICVLCVFVVLPALVLLLHPTRAFQRSLSCCRVRWHALHAFADTFQGYYKNGTEVTSDYRYLAGLYHTLRIVLISLILGFVGPYYWMLVVMCCAVTSLVFAILHPYKKNWINVWDSVAFAHLVVLGHVCKIHGATGKAGNGNGNGNGSGSGKRERETGTRNEKLCWAHPYTFLMSIYVVVPGRLWDEATKWLIPLH